MKHIKELKCEECGKPAEWYQEHPYGQKSYYCDDCKKELDKPWDEAFGGRYKHETEDSDSTG